MIKRLFFLVLAALLSLTILGIIFFLPVYQNNVLISPLSQNFFKQVKPLDKYNFENLRKKEYQGSEIKLEKVIKGEDVYTSYLFSYESEGKKVTGMANIPNTRNGKRPVVILLRGYADDEIYFTGLGTRKVAGVFAENGFITLAPDFLGFGGSDTSSADILKSRFERPLTVLNLLASVKSIPEANPDKIFMWGHSNGGQIALSVLEITQKNIPTVLWAPVTEGFPKSVLQYIGELDDQGIKVKTAIDNFLLKYEPEKYSIDNYYSDIQATIQLHLGLADPLISEEEIDEFAKTIADLGKNINYYKYPRNDHNLSRDWDLIVSRDLQFFRKHF